MTEKDKPDKENIPSGLETATRASRDSLLESTSKNLNSAGAVKLMVGNIPQPVRSSTPQPAKSSTPQPAVSTTPQPSNTSQPTKQNNTNESNNEN